MEDNHCLNGGILVPILGKEDYQCICPKTRIGKNCKEMNYCQPNPCKNGGQCHNIPDEPFYICTCTVGFIGKHCDLKDPCRPNPCLNNGECTHDDTTFTCICQPQFRGNKCEELNNCSPNPCVNGGTCIAQQGEGKFVCECSPGWMGTVCDRRSYCSINPCKNGGTCRETDTHFVCECVKGFSGQTCEDRPCYPNPCMNGGTCNEEGDHFRCICLSWTTGSYCEENRPCITNPCLHDGKCIDAYSGFQWSFGPLQYYCLCKPPYKGIRCEIHACKYCHKNAHCVLDHCVCDEGYEGNGEQCTKILSPCHPNPCLNGGVCQETPDRCTGSFCGFRCICKKPYQPPFCKDRNPCDPDPCQNGNCIVTHDTFKCICEEGYKGKYCRQREPCIPNPCQHHGTCKSLNETAKCSCRGMWLQPLCKECGCPRANKDGIPNLSCDAGGTCICPKGYIPDMTEGACKKNIENSPRTNPCLSEPCTNGGSCINIDNKDFVCQCLPGYTGKACQWPPSTSAPNIVFAPAIPQEHSRADDGPVRPCQLNPCRNGGICKPNKGAYDCICPPRYTGPHCDIDRCANCHKEAKCVAGKCKCKPGFIGNGYQCEKEICEAVCVEWSTCIDGNCICDPGYQMHNGHCQGNLDTATAHATSNQPYNIYLQKKLRPIPPQGLIQNEHDNEEEPTETPTLSHTTPRMTFTTPTKITKLRSTKALKPPTNPSPRTSPPTVQKTTSSPMTTKSTTSDLGETTSTTTPPNTTPSPVDRPDVVTTIGPPGGPDSLVTFGPPGPPGDLDKTSPPGNTVYGPPGSDSATGSNNNYGPPSI